MRRVSSAVRLFNPGPETGVSRPFTSTKGGRPGEKNRSLTLADVRNMASNRAGVRPGLGADAGAAAAAPAATGTTLGLAIAPMGAMSLPNYAGLSTVNSAGGQT